MRAMTVFDAFNASAMVEISTGKDGCHCSNMSDVLASLDKERFCKTRDEQNGVLVAAEGPCVPHSFGSNYCLQHDLMHDPISCQQTDAEGKICNEPWCWVEKSCISSSEQVMRSKKFPSLFYSYTTCNSTGENWNNHESRAPLGGLTIEAAVPGYWEPYHYKRNLGANGWVILASPGAEYWDNSIPFEGIVIDYLQDLARISEGDFKVEFTYQSKAGVLGNPNNWYNALIQDVGNGLVDMGAGLFWITGERLRKVSYSPVPILEDPSYLVIPRAYAEAKCRDPLFAQIKRVFLPFSWTVWGVILLVVCFTSLLSVWISHPPERGPTQDGVRHPIPKSVYARFYLDEILEKGMFFASAGVEQDKGASLSHKILMFGYATFILIVVSAYVANLAAYLTLSSTDAVVYTMANVLNEGKIICAPSSIKNDLKSKYPDAKFYEQGGESYESSLQSLKAGDCDVMTVEGLERWLNGNLMKEFCEANLTVTDEVVWKGEIAFPVKAEIASGLSYWIYQAEHHHSISFSSHMKKYQSLHGSPGTCEQKETNEENGPTQIKVVNLLFPILFFVVYAVIAILVQLYHQWAKTSQKGGRRSWGDRRSAIWAELSGNRCPMIHDSVLSGDSSTDDDHVEEDGEALLGEMHGSAITVPRGSAPSGGPADQDDFSERSSLILAELDLPEVDEEENGDTVDLGDSRTQLAGGGPVDIRLRDAFRRTYLANFPSRSFDCAQASRQTNFSSRSLDSAQLGNRTRAPENPTDKVVRLRAKRHAVIEEVKECEGIECPKII